MKVYNKFVSDFSADIKLLDSEPNFEGKFGGIEKYRKDMNKKHEQVERREANSWDEALMNFGDTESGITKILDKMNKTITDSIRKAKNKGILSQDAMKKSLASVTKIKTETQKDVNTKNMLSSLCNTVLKKNHDLYLTHEEDMEKERLFRKDLADECQVKMNSINDDLNEQKNVRITKIEDNNNLRKEINAAIEEFKTKE